MAEVGGDYEFQSPVAQPPELAVTERHLPWAVMAFVAVLIVGAGVAYFVTQHRATAPAAAVPAPVEPAAAESTESAVAEGEAITLPPLDDSDALVRERIGLLSSHPLVSAWLATNGLVRNFVVIVDNLSRGLIPAGRLRVFKLAEPFRVLTRGSTVVIDARNYQRYSPVAAAAASIDARAAARTYATFKPLLQMAYEELGNQQPFDRAVESAIVGLLAVPLIDGDTRLIRSREGVGYEYADPRLEALTGAQKQLLRMGSENVRLIQQQLRAFALAIGIPSSRLS